MKFTSISFDDLKDLVVNIVGDLVIEKLVPDCTDTDDDTEFKFQDAILDTMCKKLGIENEDD